MGCDNYERDVYNLNKDENQFWIIVEFKECRQHKFIMTWKEFFYYVENCGGRIENVKIMRGI